MSLEIVESPAAIADDAIADDETDLQQQYELIKQQALNFQLTVFPSAPSREHFGAVYWDDDSETFLNIAHHAGVRTIYLELSLFDYSRVLREKIAELNGFQSEQEEWLSERINEATAQFAQYSGSPSSLHCLWVKEGISHNILKVSDWAIDFTLAFEEAITHAKEVESKNRRTEMDELSVRRLKQAKTLAGHERFTEATSEAKREFMAEQLFPDEESYEWSRIASLATIYHWWEVEPAERTKIADQAKPLHQQGYSIRKIAAMLVTTEAKVRKALLVE